MTLGKKGVSGDGPDTFNSPTDVAVAPNGDIFVSDGHVNSRIVKFSKDGTFIKAWGKRGDGPGEFNVPHTIFFDSRGRLLVGDRVEPPDPDLRSGRHVPRSVDAVRVAERHLHRARRHAVRRRLQRQDGAVRRQRQGWIDCGPKRAGAGRRRGGRRTEGSIYVGETVTGHIGTTVTGHTVKKLVRK